MTTIDIDKFKSVLMIGETSSVEFKRCGGEIEHDVFESICAFLNRFGGDVYLGVLNDGTVEGVNAATAAEKMKNIINVVGNPNVFKPSPYIEVDSFVWDGKTVIRVHAPVSGDVHSYKGEIYDRMGEVDVKIRATAQIADLYMRKKGIYTEREIFPHLTLDDFRLDLLPLVRQEAQNHLTNGKRHPWTGMGDEELFRASGLIDEDKATKVVGFNLAAVLLMGKDETIMRVCPQYETDALLRVVNVDRYDDRHIARTNLLESYDELLEFASKHLPTPFFLEKDKRLNLRDIIVREMVANLLIHREFTSLDKSMFVIERERMYTSNPCNPIRDGRITPENVHPKAKNPIIAGFFREIGRADRLGSGIRNLYKYCKDYGGEDPVFTEGNEFVISVSLKKLDPIRFPFEKPSIENGKPSIGDTKPSIAPQKPSIRNLIDTLGLMRPTCENIVSLYEKLTVGEVFGRSRVMEIVGLSYGPAGDLLNTMLRNGLLDTVKGHGKGKYRFSNRVVNDQMTFIGSTAPLNAPINEPINSDVKKVSVDSEKVLIDLKKPLVGSEKPSIGIGKVPIEIEKVPIVKTSEDTKLHIGPEKVHIESEKVHIGPQKVHIESEKVHIEERLMALKLSQPTVNHVLELLESYGLTVVFGRGEICKTTGLKERGASKLIGILLNNGVLDVVTGQGKGKYRFRDFTNPVNPVNPV